MTSSYDEHFQPPTITEPWYQPDDALRQVLARERAARLVSYQSTPHDVLEHIGIEHSIAQGGYAHRQIHELIQNGADAIYRGERDHGWIEVCLTSTHLYVANTGAMLDAQGIYTLLHAHVSQKRGGEIGRFGVGFKSVLRVTTQPQLFSRTLSLSFDASRARTTIEQHLERGVDKAPTLRLAWERAPDEDALDDPYMRRMMQWASSIVRLPLSDDEDIVTSLQNELTSFDASFLLFAPTPLHLSFVDEVGALTRRRNMRSRQLDVDEHLWELVDDGQVSTWHVHSTSLDLQDRPDALKDAGARHRRETYEVHWAVPTPTGHTDGPQHGQFWVFFPLDAASPVPGIISAPWKTSDDRQHLLPGVFNEALLDKTALWMTSLYQQWANARDVSLVMDRLPADGLNAWAGDRLATALNQSLPHLDIWPDRAGALGPLSRVLAHPSGVPVEMIKQWLALAPTQDVAMLPVEVYSTATRRERVERLCASQDAMMSMSAWLTMARGHQPKHLAFVRACWQTLPEHREVVLGAHVIPLREQSFAALNEPHLYLAGGDDFQWLDSLRLVHDDALTDEHTRTWLVQDMRVRPPTDDDVFGVMSAHLADRRSRDGELASWEWLSSMPEQRARAFLKWNSAHATAQFYAMTYGAGWQPPTHAYMGSQDHHAAHAISMEVMSPFASLLVDAGFTRRVIDAQSIWNDAEEDALVLIPIGPWLDGSDVDGIAALTHDVCHWPWPQDACLAPQLFEWLRDQGLYDIDDVRVPWGELGAEVSDSWQALEWRSMLSWSPVIERALPESRAPEHWSASLWSLCHARALACDDDTARQAFYTHSFEHGAIPNAMRLGDDVLDRTQVMVTGNADLARTARTMGWRVLSVGRMGRFNAMKVGMKLLTGVPKLEPQNPWLQAPLRTLAPTLAFWAEGKQGLTVDTDVTLCDGLNEVMLSAKGRQEQAITHAWHNGQLFIQCSQNQPVEPRILKALETLDLLTTTSAYRARLAITPQAPSAQWLAWFGAHGVPKEAADSVLAAQTTTQTTQEHLSSEERLASLFDLHGDTLRVHLPAMVAAATTTPAPVDVPASCRLLGFPEWRPVMSSSRADTVRANVMTWWRDAFAAQEDVVLICEDERLAPWLTDVVTRLGWAVSRTLEASHQPSHHLRQCVVLSAQAFDVASTLGVTVPESWTLAGVRLSREPSPMDAHMLTHVFEAPTTPPLAEPVQVSGWRELADRCQAGDGSLVLVCSDELAAMEVAQHLRAQGASSTLALKAAPLSPSDIVVVSGAQPLPCIDQMGCERLVYWQMHPSTSSHEIWTALLSPSYAQPWLMS